MKITIAGAGTWGTALGITLSQKGYPVCIWSRFPEEVEKLSRERVHPNLPDAVIPDEITFTSDIATAAANADFLLMVVPSVYTRETMRDFAPYVEEKTILVSAAKGIEKDTLMTLTEVLRDELQKAGKQNEAVAMSGPTHAEEVARNLPTLIVCACENTDSAAKVQALFDGTCIRPYVNPDEKGVQYVGYVFIEKRPGGAVVRIHFPPASEVHRRAYGDEEYGQEEAHYHLPGGRLIGHTEAIGAKEEQQQSNECSHQCHRMQARKTALEKAAKGHFVPAVVIGIAYHES